MAKMGRPVTVRGRCQFAPCPNETRVVTHRACDACYNSINYAKSMSDKAFQAAADRVLIMARRLEYVKEHMR